MFISILVFLLVLSILILVHELGHFFVAKKMGVRVEEFGFGIPPRIYGKKIGETIYSINALPFGGFVRLHGELVEDKITDPKRSFLGKSALARSAVILAGVVMNFLLAIVCFAVVYSVVGIPADTKTVKVLDVSSGSPAQTAKIVVGDVILKVDETEVSSSSSFVDAISVKKGKRVTLTLGDRKVVVIPRENPPEGEGPLGVAISTTEIVFPPLWKRPFIGIYYGFKDAIFWGKNIVLGFGNLFGSLFKGKIPSDISGPVGIFAITSEAAKTGVIPLINLLGIISVNLAVLNIIPFPGLDGGRLLFILIEKVWGRKVLPKIEATIHSIGMLVLILLIFAITVSDIRKLIDAGGIGAFLGGMIK